MLFDKLKNVLKTLFKRKERCNLEKSDLISKINYALKNKRENEDVIREYRDDIKSLKTLKLCPESAEGLVFNIRKDVLSGTINFKDINITESELNKLLKRQMAYNLRIRFKLLKETWYRDIGGGVVIQEIETLTNNNQTTWEELRIDRAEFHSVKNHIKAAK